MSSARYVGRVGALAVALGIGAVIAGVPGVAWADTEGEPDPSDAPGVSAPETPDGSAGDVSDTDVGGGDLGDTGDAGGGGVCDVGDVEGAILRAGCRWAFPAGRSRRRRRAVRARNPSRRMTTPIRRRSDQP